MRLSLTEERHVCLYSLQVASMAISTFGLRCHGIKLEIDEFNHCDSAALMYESMSVAVSILRFYRHPVKSSVSNARCRRRSGVEIHAMRSGYGCRLIGVGSSTPETVVTNSDLEKIVDTTDAWISQRTGIRQRRVLASHEKLSDHAAQASLRALEMGCIDATDVDCILLATSSPEDIFGSACQVRCVFGDGILDALRVRFSMPSGRQTQWDLM